MSRLTPGERRRVYLTQQRARASMLVRLNAPITVASDSGADERRCQLLFTVMVIIAMLAGGVLVSQMLEFHPPDSLIEVLFPR